MGYYFQDQIAEYESNHRPRMEATHKTADGIVESIKEFAKQHPRFKILPADDPYSHLIGFVVYDELNREKIAKHLTMSLFNPEIKNNNLDEILEKEFNEHFENGGKPDVH